ncbi:MAG: site-2 protease family protein [Thermoplasmatota archaeon]
MPTPLLASYFNHARLKRAASPMNGWLVFFALLAAYLLVVTLLRRRGVVGPKTVTNEWGESAPAAPPAPGPDAPIGPGGTARGEAQTGFDLMGPLLIWRTESGKRLIDRIARAKRFWAVFGDVGIGVTFVAGLLIFAALIAQLVFLAVTPGAAAATQATSGPQFVLGIPGVNPLIPVGYGIFGLVVALIIHEGAHGVLARAHDLKVKSLGLLFFIVPVGAFVEPDEKDIESAPTRVRNRVFGAGVTTNITMAIVAGFLFSAMVGSSMAPVNDGHGLGVGEVTTGAPAGAAGLAIGDVLTSLNGVPLTNATTFVDVMNTTHAGQVITLGVVRGGTTRSVSVTLADKFDALAAAGTPTDQNPASNKGKGFLGVRIFELALAAGESYYLAHPLDGLRPFLFYVSYPLFVFTSGVDVLNAPTNQFFVLEGPFSLLPAPAFFIVANALFWLFWLNLMLGTFNALPAGPLDGGQMFRASLRDRLFRHYGVDRSKIVLSQDALVPGVQIKGADDDTQRRIDRAQKTLRSVTWVVGVFILMLILTPLIGPRLLSL